jgi:hypothetical protein
MITSARSACPALCRPSGRGRRDLDPDDRSDARVVLRAEVPVVGRGSLSGWRYAHEMLGLEDFDRYCEHLEGGQSDQE